MKTKHKKITAKTLKEWNACREGYERFNQLFPKGADLKTASEGLIADGHISWSNWLWEHCAQSADEEYQIQCVSTAGYAGTATAGYAGTATAGDEGIIIIHYWDSKTEKYGRKMSFVGANALKKDTPYKLDDNFNFIEAK